MHVPTPRRPSSVTSLAQGADDRERWWRAARCSSTRSWLPPALLRSDWLITTGNATPFRCRRGHASHVTDTVGNATFVPEQCTAVRAMRLLRKVGLQYDPIITVLPAHSKLTLSTYEDRSCAVQQLLGPKDEGAVVRARGLAAGLKHLHLTRGATLTWKHRCIHSPFDRWMAAGVGEAAHTALPSAVFAIRGSGGLPAGA